MSEVDTGSDMEIVLWDIKSSKYMKGIPHRPSGIDWNADNLINDQIAGEIQQGKLLIRLKLITPINTVSNCR